MWIYRQKTGDIWNPDGVLAYQAYSGFGSGKNNPDAQHIRSVGPIPRGIWVIGEPYDSKKIGKFALPLYEHNHDACNRTYFRIHGDSISNPGNASKGCIISPKNIRYTIHESKDRMLMVIE